MGGVMLGHHLSLIGRQRPHCHLFVAATCVTNRDLLSSMTAHDLDLMHWLVLCVACLLNSIIQANLKGRSDGAVCHTYPEMPQLFSWQTYLL